MKKILTIGGEPYEIDYTEENAFKVLDLILEWMQEKNHSASSCGESLHQNNDCLIDAPSLISDIVDDVLHPKYVGEDRDDFF